MAVNMFGMDLPDLTKWSIGDLIPNLPDLGKLFGTGVSPPVFGVSHRDPLQETASSLGLNDGQRGGIAQMLKDAGLGDLMGTANNGNLLNLPMLGDFARTENYLNPIRGNVNNLNNNFLNPMLDLVKQRAQTGVDPGVRNQYREAAKGASGAELKDAITALNESFNPNAFGRSDQEAGLRYKFGSSLATDLSNQDLAFENLKKDYAGLGGIYGGLSLGSNELLKNLQPGQYGSALTAFNAGLTDTDISNQRYEELAQKGDISNLVNYLTGQVNNFTNTMMQLPGVLFPGRGQPSSGGTSGFDWANLALGGATGLVGAGAGIPGWSSIF